MDKTDNRKKIDGQWVAIGGIYGLQLGYTLSELAFPYNSPESLATEVNDDMTFEEALAEARSELGPGGVFCWHGCYYSTYLQDEVAGNHSSDEPILVDPAPQVLYDGPDILEPDECYYGPPPEYDTDSNSDYVDIEPDVYGPDPSLM